LPTISVTLEGLTYPEGSDKNWLIDFNSDTTVVWTKNCTNGSDSCTEAPLYLNCSFNATNEPLKEKTKVVGGYKVTGYTVHETMTIGDSSIFMTVL